VPGVGEGDASAGDQKPEREVEVPRLRDQRGECHAAADEDDPEAQHPPRALLVHEHAEERRADGRDHESDRERAGREPAIPAELVEDRRVQQRERGPRVDADSHGDKRHRHHDPTVEEGKSH
jgi:hypothetical protein